MVSSDLIAHPIGGFDLPFAINALLDSFHDTSGLIRDISYPIVFSCRYDEVSMPFTGISVDLVIFVDGEFGGIFD